ncbi:PE-PGRS family protein [Trichinella pseudospiralis]
MLNCSTETYAHQKRSIGSCVNSRLELQRGGGGGGGGGRGGGGDGGGGGCGGEILLVKQSTLAMIDPQENVQTAGDLVAQNDRRLRVIKSDCSL